MEGARPGKIVTPVVCQEHQHWLAHVQLSAHI